MRYFELRPPDTLKSAVGTDIAQHLHKRQFLGSAIVVCDHPFAMLSVVRKSWQKITRQTQVERARTLNAEEILRFTRRIIQMQRLQFTINLPDEAPCADVYFVTPDQLHLIPARCYTLYLTTAISREQAEAWSSTLLQDSLIVNYDVGIALRQFGFHIKSTLESRLLTEWHRIAAQLQQRGISLSMLDMGNEQDPDLNNTLDILLGAGKEFIELAAGFQHQVDIAQPLTDISEQTQERITTLLRLAHRVQALTPPNPHLQQIFGGTETFFLRDRAAEQLAIPRLGLGQSY